MKENIHFHDSITVYFSEKNFSVDINNGIYLSVISIEKIVG